MDPAIFRHVFDRFCARAPFLPFSLELLSGSRLEVNHPEALTLYEHHVVFSSSTGMKSVFQYRAVVRFIDTTGA